MSDKNHGFNESLLKRLRFRGAVSVGERGQVAMPAELRRELGVQASEKLMVFRLDGEGAAILLTAEGVAHLLQGADASVLLEVFGTLAAPAGKNGGGTK